MDHHDQQKTKRSPLILLPGMGGDARLYARQRAVFSELVVPNWIEPERNESLVDYAARFAKVIDPGEPCFIGGMSFGGVVSLEVATHLLTRECYLFGSIRSPRSDPQTPAILHILFRLDHDSEVAVADRTGTRRTQTESVIRGVLHQLKDCDTWNSCDGRQSPAEMGNLQPVCRSCESCRFMVTAIMSSRFAESLLIK